LIAALRWLSRVEYFALPALFATILSCAQPSRDSPFDRVSINLYTATLVAGAAAGQYTLNYGSDETQYVELDVLPDRGFYIFLIAGEMTVHVDDTPVVGSTLSVDDVSFTVRDDPELPGGWMRGARFTSSGWLATCTEQREQLTSWRWTNVADLQLETADGATRTRYRWEENDFHGVLQGDPRGFFPPLSTFVKKDEAP